MDHQSDILLCAVLETFYNIKVLFPKQLQQPSNERNKGFVRNNNIELGKIVDHTL